MADGDTERELRERIAELAKIAASIGTWEQQRWNDNFHYLEDAKAFREEFRWVRTQLMGISDAVTRTATDMELVAQQMRGSAEDIRDLKAEVKELELRFETKVADHDERIISLEKGRSRERGAWAVLVFIGTAIGTIGGAILMVIIPSWIPSWLKHGS